MNAYALNLGLNTEKYPSFSQHPHQPEARKNADSRGFAESRPSGSLRNILQNADQVLVQVEDKIIDLNLRIFGYLDEPELTSEEEKHGISCSVAGA